MAEETETERRKSKRRVLMEFDVDSAHFYGDEIDAQLYDLGEALKNQYGGEIPDVFTIYVVVGEAEGGYREVIGDVANTGGIFRAPPVEGLRGKRMVPPPPDQLDMEDVD